jgi:hypothetical protein
MHTHLHCRGSAYTVMRGVEHPVGHIDHHHVELGQAGLVLVSQRMDRLLYKLREVATQRLPHPANHLVHDHACKRK